MILSSAEHIRRYREQGYWGDRTLLDAFHEHVLAGPERVAVVDPPNKKDLVGLPSSRVSFRELDRAADAVATALLDLGIQKDDVIMVQLPNIWELALLYIAAARAGVIIAPLPVQWRSREFTYIAALTGARAFIAMEEFRGFQPLRMAAEQRAGLGSLKYVIPLAQVREWAEGEIDRDRLAAVRVDADDLFTICWTSGTEAEPKGCPLSHNNWTFQGNIIRKAAGFRAGDVQLCLAPLVNMTALGVQFIPWLLFGGTFVLHHPLDVEMCLRQLGEEKVNFIILPPAVLNMILKHPRIDEYDLSTVRTITSGSAPLSPWALQEFQRRWGIEVVNIWGQNEGTGLISGPADIPEVVRRAEVFPGWGRPGAEWSVAGVETKVVDPENGRVVTEAGGVGELAYRGPNVMPAYFGRPDLSKKAFDEEGFFYTGDLFLLKEGNQLAFFDRRKDIIIRGGFNISAQEVENSLQGHSGVLDVAVVAMRDEILGERTCVFVVPRPGQTVDLAELVVFLKDKDMAVYKLPERLEIIDRIPRNPVGKIIKSVLREEINRRLRTERGEGEDS
ncbi:MAG TPA: class I adenylate-forming enzyme family protein [Spirochaetia bacterium]|nr:class I adenylate-forming enzyme family protein [Spirochaetia bacterium]